MHIQFIKDNDIQSFSEALSIANKHAKSIMILSCIEDAYDIEAMNALLQSYPLPIIGGMFPKIIYKNHYYDTGSMIISLDDTLDVAIVKNLSDQSSDRLDATIESAYGELDKNVQSMFVFVDGLSKNINTLILTLFENFGLTLNYIGGGAGSLSFEQQPCLFSNQGILTDAAILATTKRESAVGVKHGWNPVSNPLKVTSSQANRILELDYRPAFEVYKEIVESLQDKRISSENFFDIAKAYPLGINKLSGEMVVRDPIMIEESTLVCVGDVAENSFVSILNGSHETLIKAAKEAKTNAPLSKKHFTFFIDCISRVLFMEKAFQKEIDIIYDESIYFVGILSLGEIANNKKHYLEFYNKTAVVANIERLS